jgi:thiamine-monophosphate kinase
MGGARKGDVLAVTGPLGGSILGKHLIFDPRLDVAQKLQEKVSVNSATDISDSLLIDLAHVMRKSKLSALLDLSQIPVADAAKELAKSSGKSSLSHALEDGEDFELLLSLSKEELARLDSDASTRGMLVAIGEVTAGKAGAIIDSESGNELEPKGYQH